MHEWMKKKFVDMFLLLEILTFNNPKKKKKEIKR
jgi:hypothetical protein